MAYKFKFNDNSFICAKSIDGLSNVIESIRWWYGNDEVSVPGLNSFPLPSPDNFVPFENLTEDEVTSWLESANDMDELNKSVESEIEKLKSQSNQEVLPPPFQS